MNENINPIKTYEIKNIYTTAPLLADSQLETDCDPDTAFNYGPWENCKTLTLDNYMGEKPKHFPRTHAKLLYDEKNLYVAFKVEDNFVRCTVKKTNGPVCTDSCVEFFFSPNEKTNKENYFNIETNCGGTILMQHGNKNITQRKPIDEKICSRIQIHHSLPRTVDPEITEPKTWLLLYRLPFEIFTAFEEFNTPQPGTIWRANFYKCADKSSMPHWLTWNKVQNPSPNFHLPEHFGNLKFL